MPAARLEQLAEIECAVWAELGSAVREKGHPWRVGVLATLDGERADARSVVLRDIEASASTLLIYTDERSAKARQVERHPLGTLVLWSDPLGWQLRLRVHLSLQTSGLEVSSRWAQLKMSPAAHDYLSPLPPAARWRTRCRNAAAAASSRSWPPRCRPSTGWSCTPKATAAPSSTPRAGAG